MAIPYWTTKLKSANIIAMAIWDPTAKFNSCQYFRLYGMLATLCMYVSIRRSFFLMSIQKTVPWHGLHCLLRLLISIISMYVFDHNRIVICGLWQLFKIKVDHNIIVFLLHARLSYPKREKESSESCISQLYYWNVFYPAVVAQCLQSKPVLQDQHRQQNSTALRVVCMCIVDWCANCGPQKHDSWSTYSASKYGHAVKLHSIAFTRLFLLLWVGESGTWD